MKDVLLYDTTLRDGCQAEDVSFTLEDKLRIAQKLDDLGIDYIEGGWPGSNPRDEQFFIEARKLKLGNTKLTAFGSTRRAGVPCENDASIQALLGAETPAVTIFGKAWKFQATAALRISPDIDAALFDRMLAVLAEYRRTHP